MSNPGRNPKNLDVDWRLARWFESHLMDYCPGQLGRPIPAGFRGFDVEASPQLRPKPDVHQAVGTRFFQGPPIGGIREKIISPPSNGGKPPTSPSETRNPRSSSPYVLDDVERDILIFLNPEFAMMVLRRVTVLIVECLGPMLVVGLTVMRHVEIAG